MLLLRLMGLRLRREDCSGGQLYMGAVSRVLFFISNGRLDEGVDVIHLFEAAHGSCTLVRLRTNLFF